MSAHGMPSGIFLPITENLNLLIRLHSLFNRLSPVESQIRLDLEKFRGVKTTHMTERLTYRKFHGSKNRDAPYFLGSVIFANGNSVNSSNR